MRVIDISKISYKSDTVTKIFDNSFLLQEKDKTVFDKKSLAYISNPNPNPNRIN